MIEIDYKNLVNNYYENLNSNLRHFKGGPDFLETWAHDEDHTRSIQEILHLAVDHGVNEISLRLDSDTMEKINCQKLEKHFSEPWVLEFRKDQITFGKKKNTVLDDENLIPALYRQALLARSKELRFLSKNNSNAAMGRMISAGESGFLMLTIDTKENIQNARHSGFTSFTAVVMDAFCEIISGLPLQEATEHGVLRLEQSLREGAATYSKGLIIPEDQSALFRTPLGLIRKIYAESGAEPKRNTYKDSISPEWITLPMDTQLSKGRAYLLEAIKALGLQPEVELTAIRNSTRFILSYIQNPKFPDFGNAMIKLEFLLRKNSGLPVELQLETTEDRNKRTKRTNRA